MKKSSSCILPNIPPIKNNAKLNKSVFMTITDDMGFAKMQIDKMNDSIKKEK